MVRKQGYYSTMITININEAKTHLSHYLEEVARGETVIICKRNRPLAEIRPIAEQPATPRPIGLAKGEFQLAASFFEPLPDEIERLFAGDETQ